MKNTKIQSNENQNVETNNETANKNQSRRAFLGKIGKVGAAVTVASVVGVEPFIGSPTSTAHAVQILPGPGNMNAAAAQRRAAAKQIRVQAANQASQDSQYIHPSNGDEELYASRIGNFSKTLPHNSTNGEVDPAAYAALLAALESANFAQMEAVPRTVTSTGRLANPFGGLVFNMEGPDSPALPIDFLPPPISSAAKAAEMIEVYWQAFLRDVPLTDYPTNPYVAQACADLTRLSDYRGPRDSFGNVTPQLLFRYPFQDTDKGPIISQFLLQNFNYDAISITPRINPRLPVINWNPDGTYSYSSGATAGYDYMTNFSEYLSRSNGEPLAGAAFGNRTDSTPRFLRSVRDMGLLAASDRIYSIYFRASSIMGGFAADPGNPYVGSNSVRQSGFATFGLAHLTDLLAASAKSERHSWYHKWYVHRHLRPEAYGLLVDRHVRGIKSYPLPAELLNSPVLPLIGGYNQQVNTTRGLGSELSYLFPQMLTGGSPSHPSAPAGHAITAGACVTILKAWFDTSVPFPASFIPKDLARDGAPTTDLPNYTGGDLTILGELNKLAHNLSAGRDMSGVHWRVADNYSGIYQGEALAISILKEAKATYPESNATFTITKFDGTTITI